MENGFWFMVGMALSPIITVVFLFAMVLFVAKRLKRSSSASKITSPLSKVLPTFHKQTRLRRQPPHGKDVKEDKDAKEVAVLIFPTPKVHNPVEHFGEDVDEVLRNRDNYDTVVVKIHSPGGTVISYGYLNSQMERLRASGLKVIATVDQIAASGGYLMAAPAHTIMATPMAMVGSIGVVAFVPNVREMLERVGIRSREFTAGDRKRMVSPFDDGSPDREKAFEEKLAVTHAEFIAAVRKYRPQVPDECFNGDVWSGTEALARGLVDELGSSNELLLKLNETQALVFVEETEDRFERLFGRLGASMSESFAARVSEMIGLRF